MTPSDIRAAVATWPESLRADFAERSALIWEGCNRPGRPELVTIEQAERWAFDVLRPPRPAEQLDLGVR